MGGKISSPWRTLRRTDDFENLASEKENLEHRVKQLKEQLQETMENRVPLERSWGIDDRDLFSQTKKDDILNDINALTPPNQCQNVNLIVVGAVGSGKSSLINTWLTVLRNSGEISNIATTHEQNRRSTTSKLLEIVLKNYPGGEKLCMYDCGGIYEEAKAIQEDIISAIYGHIKIGYKFQRDRVIQRNDHYYRLEPTLDKQVHCVIFVADARTIDEINQSDLEKMMHIKDTIGSDNIPARLVLTKVDTLDLCDSGDLRGLFRSRHAKKKIETAKRKFCFQDNQVLPIANYVKGTGQNLTQDMLALIAIKNIFQEALVFVGNYRYGD